MKQPCPFEGGSQWMLRCLFNGDFEFRTPQTWGQGASWYNLLEKSPYFYQVRIYVKETYAEV